LEEIQSAEPRLAAKELAVRVRKRFAVRLHPRTIEKALSGRAKRGRRKRP
jgi:hypothetical protein